MIKEFWAEFDDCEITACVLLQQLVLQTLEEKLRRVRELYVSLQLLTPVLTKYWLDPEFYRMYQFWLEPEFCGVIFRDHSYNQAYYFNMLSKTEINFVCN